DPGQRLQPLTRAGNLPAMLVHDFLRQGDEILCLGAEEADVLISSWTRSSPSAAIFSGVSAAANSAGVALLTPASVACAESTTATSSVNGWMCLSSPLGSGLAAWKRRNASSISAVVHCGSAPAAATWSAAERLAGVWTLAAGRARDRRRLCAVLRG